MSKVILIEKYDKYQNNVYRIIKDKLSYKVQILQKILIFEYWITIKQFIVVDDVDDNFYRNEAIELLDKIINPYFLN